MSEREATAWQKFLATGHSDMEPAMRKPEPNRKPAVSEAQQRALQRAGRKQHVHG